MPKHYSCSSSCPPPGKRSVSAQNILTTISGPGWTATWPCTRRYRLGKSHTQPAPVGIFIFTPRWLSAHNIPGRRGRSSDIPIGDLLNNVYSTLNTLTASNKFHRWPISRSSSCRTTTTTQRWNLRRPCSMRISGTTTR